MDERSEQLAKRFERPLLVAAVLTIPVTIAQLLPADDPWLTIADVLNWGSWLAFLAEVVVMLAVVPSKGAWLRKHPVEVAIVVLTPPFLTSVVQSVRVLRGARHHVLVRRRGRGPDPVGRRVARVAVDQHSEGAPRWAALDFVQVGV